MAESTGKQVRRVAMISTGGTIEKTYDERSGTLENRHSIVQRMLARLRLEDVQVNTIQLLSKDSLYITDDDRARILSMVRVLLGGAGDPSEGGTDAVVLLHGTDTLEITGDLLAKELQDLAIPVVLTGAMRPYEMKRSDALQNINEAIFATGVLEPGVWFVGHGKALRFPGVTKDRDRGTFVK